MKSSWLGGAFLGALLSPTLLLVFYRQVHSFFDLTSLAESYNHSLTPPFYPPLLDLCTSALVGALVVRCLWEKTLPHFSSMNALTGSGIGGFYFWCMLTNWAGPPASKTPDPIFSVRLFVYLPLLLGALVLFLMGAQGDANPSLQLQIRRILVWLGGTLSGAFLLQWMMWACMVAAIRISWILPHIPFSCPGCVDPKYRVFTHHLTPKYLFIGAGLGFLSTALYHQRLRSWRVLSGFYGAALCLSIIQEMQGYPTFFLKNQFLFVSSVGESEYLLISAGFLVPPFLWGLLLAFFALLLRARPALEHNQ